VFVRRAGQKEEQIVSTTLHVGEEETLIVWLASPH
jgi:hypothetical protein